MTTDDLLIQYLSEGVKRADRAVNRAAVFAIIVALLVILSACGGSHSDTQRDQQGNEVIGQPKEKTNG